MVGKREVTLGSIAIVQQRIMEADYDVLIQYFQIVGHAYKFVNGDDYLDLLKKVYV